MEPSPIVRSFFDRQTGSLQYVFHDPDTKRGAIVDPVWNFCAKSGSTSTESADEILAYVAAEGIVVDWILDTHPHADHFSAAVYLAAQLPGAQRGIGEKVLEIQKLWQVIYNDAALTRCGDAWDRLFAEGDSFRVGNLTVRVMLSPGHTLASVSYVVGDAAFVHDTLMMPASGTSRADFPGGSARQLWTSIRAILDLLPQTRLFVGHDYPNEVDAPQGMATVAEHRAANKHVRDGIDEAGFVGTREARDRTLPLPALMLYALQVNLRGGRLPAPEDDGRSYFKIPANYFHPPGQ